MWQAKQIKSELWKGEKNTYKAKKDQKTVEIAQCKKKLQSMYNFFSIGLCIRIEKQNILYFIIIKYSENCEFEIAKINQFWYFDLRNDFKSSLSLHILWNVKVQKIIFSNKLI